MASSSKPSDAVPLSVRLAEPWVLTWLSLAVREFTFFSAASARAVAALISSDAASAPLLTAAASMDAMSDDAALPFLPPMDAVSERTLAISSSTADLFFTSDSSRRRSFVSPTARSSSA